MKKEEPIMRICEKFKEPNLVQFVSYAELSEIVNKLDKIISYIDFKNSKICVIEHNTNEVFFESYIVDFLVNFDKDYMLKLKKLYK